MITRALQDWAQIATMIAVGVTLYASIARPIDRGDAGLEKRIDVFREDMKSDLGLINTRLQTLEERTYELSRARHTG